MICDAVRSGPRLFQKRRVDIAALILCAVVLVGSGLMYLRETEYQYVDFQVHMLIAADFDFTDLHSITSRLAYPLWHLIVACLYQLGMPIAWAASLVSAVCKATTYLMVYFLVTTISGDRVRRPWVALLSFALVILTGLRITAVTPNVYKGVGSPNVWHNPTQQIVTLAMLFVMPWLAHCWYEFQNAMESGISGYTLPWWKVLVLGVLLMGSLACKPTFMQALLPAAFAMFLVELIRRKSEWRYFGQIVLAFLPSVAYFLLQYLYYTGVVVEYTSGVEIGITGESAWLAIRNTLMMSACPLAALIACRRKGLLKDRMLVLALLMTAFSVLEAMTFRETGLREGHGNFTWAANSSSFFLWVVMAGIALRCLKEDWEAGWTKIHTARAAVVGVLFGWHVFSGIYYLCYLFASKNAF